MPNLSNRRPEGQQPSDNRAARQAAEEARRLLDRGLAGEVPLGESLKSATTMLVGAMGRLTEKSS